MSSELRLDEPIWQIAPLATGDADGGWPCGFCGALFPVVDSWRVTLARTGTVIVCPGCAETARRDRARGRGRDDGHRSSGGSNGSSNGSGDGHRPSLFNGGGWNWSPRTRNRGR